MTAALRCLYRAARRAVGAVDPSDLWMAELDALRERKAAAITLVNRAMRQDARRRINLAGCWSCR